MSDEFEESDAVAASKRCGFRLCPCMTTQPRAELSDFDTWHKANVAFSAVYMRKLLEQCWNDSRAADRAARGGEPVATRGTDAIVTAWNDLPDKLRLDVHLIKLFEAVKTCRDVPAPADRAARVAALVVEAQRLASACSNALHRNLTGSGSPEACAKADLTLYAAIEALGRLVGDAG